jgi:3'(2'), 5'-bisphosphate nucleotidase
VRLTDAALAAEVARDTGELLVAPREEVGFYDPYDLGNTGDKQSNALILQRLRDERPGDAVLSEEAVDDLSCVVRRPGVDRRSRVRHPGVLDAGPR